MRAVTSGSLVSFIGVGIATIKKLHLEASSQLLVILLEANDFNIFSVESQLRVSIPLFRFDTR